ncbi:MAG: MG2 domain-containing protein [Candidatus Sericytochromatia bacterium]
MIEKVDLKNKKMKKITLGLVASILISVPVMSRPIMNKPKNPVKFENTVKNINNKNFKLGEIEFEKHNYKEAVELYKKVLNEKTDDYTKKETILRLIQSLIMSRNWDESIDLSNNSLKKFEADNHWQGRLNNLVANLYKIVPHQGYKRNNKVYRNENTSREGIYIYLGEEDQKTVVKHFKDSKNFYYKVSPSKQVNQEIINLNFEFAEELIQTSIMPPIRPLSRESKESSLKQFPENLSIEDSIVFLFDEVFELNKLAQNSHNEALSLFRKASYFVRKNYISYDYENTKDKKVKNQNPIPLLEKIVKNYPKDELAPESLYGIGQIYSSKYNLVSALEYYQDLIKKYPKSIRVSDSKAEIQEIKSKNLNLINSGVQSSKDKAKITISSKNIKNVQLNVYKVDLVQTLKRNLEKPDMYFNSFNQNFGDKIEEIKKQSKEKVLSLNIDIEDKGDYQTVSKEVNLPNIKTGTYLVEATDGKSNHSLSLFLISDMTIVKNIDKEKTIIHILDRQTGKPIKDSNIIVKENYYDNDGTGRYKTKYIQVKTNENGEYIYKKIKLDNSYSYIDVLSWKDEQVIYSNAQYYYNNMYSYNSNYKAYIYTDRPVYRPEQTVNFKEIITLTEKGKNNNLKDKKVKVTITDPQGERVFEKELEPSKFGTVNGSFQLKKGAPLGMYYINTSIDNGHIGVIQSGGQSFRVEEYKKPEFTVNVKSDNSQFKAGDKVKVTISTDYYFGSPVAEAKVKYKVVRTPFYYYYSPFSKYYWFDDVRIYSPYPRHEGNDGAVWKEGELITDKDGKAYFEFDSEKTDKDFKYDILVDVTDKSRREIKGASSVKITNNPYYAFIDVEHGFYTPNENVDIEVNLRNPNDEAVKAKGKLKIFSVKYSGEKNEKEEKTLLISKDVESDDEGKINYRWKAGKEGNYKIIFESDNDKVTAERLVWVNGKNFDGRYYKFENVEILTDKKEYKEGDIARLMLSTNYPDSNVILYTETDKEILSHKVIYIPNKSKVLEITIGKQHVPNFNIKALLIKDSTMFLENKEVFVPPVKQFLNVSINPEKETFLPSEETTLRVKTTDHTGKPVPAEISLSVADSSVYYIQEDLSGDIQKFYYGEKRYFPYSIDSSLNLYLYTINESTDKKENYQRHGGPFDYYFSYGAVSNMPVMQRALGKTAVMSSPESAPVLAETSSESLSDASVPPPMPTSKMAKAKKDSNEGGGVMKEAEIRSYFPDTALWNPMIFTDKNGNAKIDFKLPDSLTKWRISSNAIDKNSRVGSDKTEIVTRKNILARLQAPRFFIEKDQVTISGLINNDLNKSKNVKCIIQTTDELENTQEQEVTVNIPSKSEKRIDWKFNVKKAGNVKITLKALTDIESDASETTFPVYVHGIDKYVAQNGLIKENETKTDLLLDIPEQRKKDNTKLNITVNTSVISTLIDSIPYLANYPYGCVEQTTSKFIPALLVNKIVKKTGIDIGNLSQDKNENVKYLDKRNENPIYNNSVLDDMAKSGLKRIYSFQNNDGGFGWWNGFQSDTYMTAYVSYSLLLAKQSGYEIDKNVLDRALDYLSKKYNSDEEIYDKLYIAYVLSMDKRIKANTLDKFFKERENLNNYGKALLSITYSNLGDRESKEKADLICQNLKTFVEIFDETASWKNDTRWYWYWYGDRVETNTYILQAFLKSRPNDKIVPMIAKWILQNRQGNHWYSTKDTANAIYTLTEYASLNKELNPDYTISIFYGDKLLKKSKVNSKNMFSFSNSIDLTDKDLKDKGKIRIVKEGKGNLYYSSSLEYFSLEDNIKAASNMISVNREYYKLFEKKDSENKITYDKELLKDGATLKSGDLIEVKLTVKSNNDYESLIFEDMKPAGFESTELKSGYEYQNGISLNKELRDQKTVFFANNLSQGTQVINYKLRAETPGIFHALPNKSYAMYAPQVRANSDEAILKIID